MTVAIVLHRADGAPVASSFRRAAFGKDDPLVGHREIAWEGPDSMIVGRTSFIGELEVASFPHIETIVVVEGELIPTATGTARWCSGRKRRCHRMWHRASDPERIRRAVFVLRSRLRQTDEARPCPTVRRRRHQAVCFATGRGLAWPGPAMPQRQRLLQRRRGLPCGHVGFDPIGRLRNRRPFTRDGFEASAYLPSVRWDASELFTQ